MYCPSFPDALTMQTFFAPADRCARMSPSTSCRSSRSLSVFSISPLVIVLLLFDYTEIGEIYSYEHSFFERTYVLVVRSSIQVVLPHAMVVSETPLPKRGLFVLLVGWGCPEREPLPLSQAGIRASRPPR